MPFLRLLLIKGTNRLRLNWQRIRHLIRRGVEHTRKVGLLSAFERFLTIVLGIVYSRTEYHVFDRRLYQYPQNKFHLDERFVLRIIEEREQYRILLAAGCDLSIMPEDMIVDKLLDRGAVLVCILDGNDLAHSSWIGLSGKSAIFDSIFSRIDFGNVAYLGASNTYPAYRGMGLYPHALIEALRFVRAKGKLHAFINSRDDNSSSIRGICKAEFAARLRIIKVRIANNMFLLKRKTTE